VPTWNQSLTAIFGGARNKSILARVLFLGPGNAPVRGNPVRCCSTTQSISITSELRSNTLRTSAAPAQALASATGTPTSACFSTPRSAAPKTASASLAKSSFVPSSESETNPQTCINFRGTVHQWLAVRSQRVSRNTRRGWYFMMFFVMRVSLRNPAHG
jgi:hypothetical protein